MTYTDQQLQLALAKMLPEKIYIYHQTLGVTKDWFCWTEFKDKEMGVHYSVKDTEWLHVCWLIEENMRGTEEFDRYIQSIHFKNSISGSITLSWQQRAVALAKVKGVEIV